jgi:molybdopterin synthase sulfur carrier subunit
MTQLLFFGRLRDIAGRAAMIRDLPAAIRTVAELRAWLREDDPPLGEAVSARDIRVAVDQTLCLNEEHDVRNAAEVAFMPPLSGG